MSVNIKDYMGKINQFMEDNQVPEALRPKTKEILFREIILVAAGELVSEVFTEMYPDADEEMASDIVELTEPLATDSETE